MTNDIFETPSRELDRQIATKIFGWDIIWSFQIEDYVFLKKSSQQYIQMPHFSIDTDDAYLLVNKMQSLGYFNQIGSISGQSDSNNPEWKVSFYKQRGSKVFFQATGLTLGHAACKAALNVVNGITGTEQFNVHKDNQVFSTVTKQEIKEPSDAKKANIVVFPGSNKKK